MRIGIIGPGRLGSALGVLLAQHGHEIMFAGGSQAGRTRVAAAAGPLAKSGSATETAKWAEVIAFTVPFAALDEAVKSVGALEGKIVWSCVNALRSDMTGLEIGFDTSAAECVSELAPAARTVEAIPPFADQLNSPSRGFGKLSPTVFCCGDDEEAKRIVSGLVSDLGADPIDVGPLSSARYVEPAMMLLIGLAYGGKTPRTVALRLLER